MAIFLIKEVEKVMMANIYEVEAETPEEALAKYENELAGSLDLKDDFIVFDSEESTSIFEYEKH
jgi:hypothetical protein